MPMIIFQPSGSRISVPSGTNLLEACHRAGIGLAASCGGKGLCGKCRVRIVEGYAPASTGCEQALSPAELDSGWRLACLIKVENDLTVDAGSDGATRNVILTDFAGRETEPDRAVRAVPLELTPPSLQDQMCDIGRITKALGMDKYPECALPLLQEVPGKLRRNNFNVNAIVFGDELLGIEPRRENPRVLGMAFDIGTTTVAGGLFDLTGGKLLAIGSRTNPQAIRGDDVVTRIDHANKGTDNRLELQKLIVDAINEIMAETCGAENADPDEVYFITAAGNTTMHHLLLGLDPANIAASPFVPAARRSLMVRATHVGIKAGHGARLYAMPNISAYVGGDIVAGLLAHEVHHADKTVLLIDIGTNGEMALRSGGVTYACSTAAGPAFEGARISCGMRAASGAISSVRRGSHDIEITTVDSAPARGLCGTGLLDAVAVLLDLGVIDETGCMVDPDDIADDCPNLPEKIAARIIEGDNGPEFILSYSDNGHPRITLTQRDVRELQLAKGAVSAGVTVMLGAVGKKASDVEEVLLAGGFGNYLSPESALRIGLLPEGIKLSQIKFIGNSALAGSRLCLLNQAMRDEAGIIAEETSYLELSGRADFQAAFADAMIFE